MLVLTLVAHYCDVCTRHRLRAVERAFDAALEECRLRRPTDYLDARRRFVHWRRRRVARARRNSWVRRRVHDPERAIVLSFTP